MTNPCRMLLCSFRRTMHALGLIAPMLFGAGTLHAQSAQRYALQLSLLASAISSGSETIGGIGAEPQLRANLVSFNESLSGFSIGIGAQWTRHTGERRCATGACTPADALTITGVFLEPRYVLTDNERVYPYLSARLGVLRQSNNFGSASMGSSLGAGGGVAFRISNRVNLDAGVQAVRQQFGDFTFSGSNAAGYFKPFFTYAAKAGFSLGFPR